MSFLMIIIWYNNKTHLLIKYVVPDFDFSIFTIDVFNIQHIKLCLLCFVLFALFALTATTVAHNTKTLKDMLIATSILVAMVIIYMF